MESYDDAAILVQLSRAIDGQNPAEPDPEFERGFSTWLLEQCGYEGLLELYGRFAAGEGKLEQFMRRAIWRAAARRIGSPLRWAAVSAFASSIPSKIGERRRDQSYVYVQGWHRGRASRLGNTYGWVRRPTLAPWTS